MDDADKTKKQLIAELSALRQRVTALETVLAAHEQTEETLQASERRYRHLMEHSLGLLCIHDLDGIVLEVNTAAARALDYEPGDFVGKSLREWIAPSVRRQFDDYLKRIRHHSSDSGLLRIVTRHGLERVWLYRNIRHDEPKSPPYILGHALDITERVQAEQALKEAHETLEQRVATRTAALQRSHLSLEAEIAERQQSEAALQESEERFRHLIEGSIQGIVIHRDLKPLFANQAFAELLGYETPEDVLKIDNLVGCNRAIPKRMTRKIRIPRNSAMS